MRVIHSHILEERKFQDKIIICYIEVANRFVEYYYGQPVHQTHRWMLPEYWAKFDAELEALLNDEEWNGKGSKERTFYLNEMISVKVKNTVDKLNQWDRKSNKWNKALCLEFLIEFKDNNKCLKEKTERNVSSNSQNKHADHHEYEPCFISNSSDNLNVPVPYTPSVKTPFSTNDNNISESLSDANYNELDHEEPYSPKPLSECSPDKNSQNQPIPPYKPMQVTREESNFSSDIQTSQELTQIEENDSNVLENLERKVKYKDKNGKSPENKKRDWERHKQKYNTEENKDKTKNAAKDKDSKDKCEEESLLTDRDQNSHDNVSVEKSEKRKRNLTDSSEISAQHKPRRSSRPPMKPKRYLTSEDTKTISKKSRSVVSTHKTPNNKQDLFGSDDDDDDYQNDDFDDDSKKTFKLGKATVTESAKMKKKHDKSDYKNKSHMLDQWLEKKSTSKLESKASPSSSTSSLVVGTKIKKQKASYSSPINYLSKEEIEERMVIEKEQMEKNRVLKEVLVKVVGAPPVKVETLSIKDLSENAVLDSFQNYKTKLNKVFQKNSKSTRSIKGHDGINHMFVIGLIDHKIQLKMLNKLSSEYEPDSEGGPAHLTLYANAMLPEWVVCLFMDTHNLTRAEAIEHIKAQEAYNLHLEAQRENSMKIDF